MPPANPKGRPKRGVSLAELVRKQVDPIDIIKWMLSVASGYVTTTHPTTGVVRIVETTVIEQGNAQKFLAERGWGKALERIDLKIDGDQVGDVDLTLFDDAKLRQYKDLMDFLHVEKQKQLKGES